MVNETGQSTKGENSKYDGYGEKLKEMVVSRGDF